MLCGGGNREDQEDEGCLARSGLLRRVRTHEREVVGGGGGWRLGAHIGVFAGEEEVFGLEVAVHDAELVAVVKHLNHVAEDGGGLALRVAGGLDDGVEEGASLAPLHHDVHRIVVFVGRLHALCAVCCVVVLRAVWLLAAEGKGRQEGRTWPGLHQKVERRHERRPGAAAGSAADARSNALLMHGLWAAVTDTFERGQEQCLHSGVRHMAGMHEAHRLASHTHGTP